MTLEWFVFPQGPFTLTPECLNDDMVASIKSVCVAYLRWCQETAGNTAFTCHDDSVLGQDANASSGVVDSFDSIFDLYRNIHSSNNKCEKFGAKNRWKVSGTKTSKDIQRQHHSSKIFKDQSATQRRIVTDLVESSLWGEGCCGWIVSSCHFDSI